VDVTGPCAAFEALFTNYPVIGIFVFTRMLTGIILDLNVKKWILIFHVDITQVGAVLFV
jgi:hypothetical protein